MDIVKPHMVLEEPMFTKNIFDTSIDNKTHIKL